MNNKNDEQFNFAELRKSLPAIILIISFFGLVLFYKYGLNYFSEKDDFALNLHTEAIGVALSVIITIFVVDVLNSRRDDRRREQDLKDRLLREVRSPEGVIARHAFHEMMERRLIYGEDSILRKAHLYRASLGKVTLRGARMDGAIMTWSDFSESEFDGAMLDNASLGSADLEGASFLDASLKNANLENANLSQAHLVGANLTGANLLGAKIYRNNLYNYAAELPDIPDSHTPQATLPDGTPITANTDLSRFTDPEHPDFWRSDDPESPAFIGHYEERLAMFQRMSKDRPSNLPPPPPPQTPPAAADAT